MSGWRMLGRMLRGFWRWVLRVARCGKLLARHDGIPRWLRWLFVIGFLPIPGPFDEMVCILAVGIMAVFYRSQLTGAWRDSGECPQLHDTGRGLSAGRPEGLYEMLRDSGRSLR